MKDNEGTHLVPGGIPELEAVTHAPDLDRSQVVIITGMSGAGRTRAAAELEDLGWYVIDNLPPMMLLHLLELAHHAGGTLTRFAAVVDVRGGQFFDDLIGVMAQLRKLEVDYRVMFLDASDEVLVRRYELVRRPHPLQDDGGLLDGISRERTLLEDIRRQSDVAIDTSSLNVHQLGRRVREAIAQDEEHPLRVNVVSFGFKYGIPLDADLVVDMRFLPNPYWITELRHLSGLDEPVRDYVLGQPKTLPFIKAYLAALEPVFTGYLEQEKRFVTLAIGCTGGMHRSVAVSEEMGRLLRQEGYRVAINARDLGKE